MSKRDFVELGELRSEYDDGRAYRSWLISIAHMKNYTKLFDMLHGIAFEWSHPFDENRAEEGISLRFRFTQNEFESAGRNRQGRQYRESMDDIPCSVMEMLIGLAIAMEDSILYDPSEGDRTHVWLWVMLKNLGVAEYSDSYIGRLSRERVKWCYEAVEEAVYTFMLRRYDCDGNGGLFPIRGSRVDQRDEELWYQANVYAIEELGL